MRPSTVNVPLAVVLVAWVAAAGSHAAAAPGSEKVAEPTAAAAVSDAGARPGSVPVVERATVRRVRLPVYLDELEPGGCDGVAAGSIEVREDGMPLPALHLDPNRLPTVHAILIDSSQKMAHGIQAVKSAARAYIEALPPGEAAMLASFDDSLLLHHPLTPDHERLAERLAWMLTGLGSNLWDSTLQIVRYLGTRPERKALILLTDGCDTQKAHAVSTDRVVARAAKTEALAIYPIGIEGRCDGDARTGDPSVALERLARATGGEYFAVRSTREVGSVLRTIRSRLDREMFVSYEPVPFGEGLEDDAESSAYRWRRIELRLRGAPRCRIRLAGGPARYEGRSWDAWHSLSGGGPAEYELIFDGDRGVVYGKLTDIAQDSGPLSRPVPGGVDVDESPQRRIETREILAILPPLERVVRPGSLPEYSFLHAMTALTEDAPALGFPRLEGGFASWNDVPFLVNGRTLLDYRRAMALAVASHPEYRAWVKDRVRRERLTALDALAVELTGEGDLDRLEAARAIVRGEAWQPEPAELERYLAAWLGDVPALRLFRATEVWLIERMLVANRQRRDAMMAAELVADAERLWNEAAVMLAAADRARVLGLLVPGYDSRSDAIGFYRIVLPRVTPIINVWHASPTAPLGARMIGWGLRVEAFAETMAAGRYEVANIEYSGRRSIAEALAEVELPVPESETPGPAVQATITLQSRIDPERRVRIGGVFMYRAFAGIPPQAPICLTVPPEERLPRDSATRRLVDSLMATKRRSVLPCILREDAGDRPESQRSGDSPQPSTAVTR